MRIRNRDSTASVIIVAEIGNNHEGDPALAAEMVRKAAECGVDAVKFQTVRAGQLVSQADEARYRRLKSFELSYEEFETLSRLAHELGLLFVSTPLDAASADALRPFVDAYKVASGDNDFFPLIERIAQTGIPLIISTGASDERRAVGIVEFVRQKWAESSISGELALLHCISSYPAPAREVNLRSIPFLAERCGCAIGYSDHTLGVEAAVLAVALGAELIEKHFTLDKNYSDFRDHQLSADPPEMTELVQRVRQASEMLGRAEKRVQPCEEPAADAIRRSIVAARDLAAGDTIGWDDLKWIRPAGGLRPGQEDRLVGKTLKRPVSRDEQLLETDVE